MALTPYATLDDLGAYLGSEPPPDCDRLLARGMELVDAALTSAMYASDTSGNPTDANVIAALKKATCAQVEWWLANGDELEQLGQYASFSIEGIAMSRGSGATGARHFRLCERAWDALRSALLVPGTVLTS